MKNQNMFLKNKLIILLTLFIVSIPISVFAASSDHSNITGEIKISAAPSASGSGTIETRILDVIKMAIEKNATVKIYKSKEKTAAADELSNHAQFDPVLKTSVSRSAEYTPISEKSKKNYKASGYPDYTKIKQSLFGYNVGYEKKLRNGISISPSVEFSTSETNSPGDTGPYTSSKVQFALIKPLSRGSGTDVNTVYEKTSRIETESASLDKLHAVSQTIRDVIIAYWNYAYYYKSLKVSNESKERAEKLYNDTKTLVDSFETPAAELDQLKASLFQKEAECERASQNLRQSKNSLKLAIGLTADSAFLPGAPIDFFPVDRIADATLEVSSYKKELVKFAETKRNDYLAVLKRLEVFNYSIPAVKNSLKPQIDLQLSASYKGMKEEKGLNAIVSSLNNNVPGGNVSAVISYSFPSDNKAARANVIKQNEQFEQSKINAEEMARQISINIENYITSVISIRSRYKRMLEAIKLYRKALENEKEKNRMGVSTLMDIVNIEDRLGQAELELESAALEYATAMVNLRYETGCLGKLNPAENCEIKIEDIIALPEVNNIEK